MLSKRVPCFASVAVLGSLLFSGCPLGSLDGPNGTTATFQPGTYDGFIIQRDPQTSSEVFVTGTVAQGSGSTLATGTFAEPDGTKIGINVSTQGSSLVFAFTGLTDQKLVVNKTTDCFVADSGAPLQGRACLNGQGILVDFVPVKGTEVVFGVDFRDNSGAGTSTPATYTLDAVLKAAKDQNFNSRAKFEASQASRENALTARLNLLPHINPGDVTSLFSLTWQTALKMVGELAPFLLPSNWIAVSTANNQLEVDRDAFQIMEADSMNTAEGLVYSLLRDEQSLATLKTYEAPIQQLLAEIAEGEILGTQAVGTTNDIRVALLSLQQMEVALQQSIAIGKRSVSQSMGILDPNAVSEVTVSSLPSLDQAVAPDLSTTQPLVLERSVELKQVNSMIALANDQLKGKWFDWINPGSSGSGETPLGAAFPASIKAGKDTVQEAVDERDAVQQTLLQNLSNAFDAINNSLTNYGLAVKTLDLQISRITQVEADMILGKPVNGSNLENAYQLALQAEVSKGEAQCEYYIAFANLNRLLYAGVYSQVVNQ